MALHGHVFTGQDGIRGFDANEKISADAAAAFHAHGYGFCVRYVRREKEHEYDLSTDEAQGILEAGLGLMIVQHVASESNWTPTASKGTQYGAVSVCLPASWSGATWRESRWELPPSR